MVTAMYRLCLNLGTTAAPLIGVALVSVSYDLLFWGEALAALVYGLIALLLLPRHSPQVEPAAAAEAVPADPVTDAAGRPGPLGLPGRCWPTAGTWCSWSHSCCCAWSTSSTPRCCRWR